MKSTFKKWSNSLAIRIPKSFTTKIDLDDLLSQVTEKNIHKEVDIGMPVGKEGC